MTEATGKYGLPLNVVFCKRCTMNNPRPSSTVEFMQKADEKNVHLPLMRKAYVRPAATQRKSVLSIGVSATKN